MKCYGTTILKLTAVLLYIRFAVRIQISMKIKKKKKIEKQYMSGSGYMWALDIYTIYKNTVFFWSFFLLLKKYII